MSNVTKEEVLFEIVDGEGRRCASATAEETIRILPESELYILRMLCSPLDALLRETATAEDAWISHVPLTPENLSRLEAAKERSIHLGMGQGRIDFLAELIADCRYAAGEVQAWLIVTNR